MYKHKDNCIPNNIINPDIRYEVDLSGYAKKSELSTVATSGLYSDLTGKPTKLSEFENDLESEDLSNITSAIDLNSEKISELNSQMDTIATVGDVNNINMLIARGIKRFKLPSGRIKVNNTIELIGNVEIYGNKDTILYAENDLSILATKKDGQVHSNIYIHDLQISQEYQGLATNLPIDLENANMCRIERVLCNSTNTNMNSVTGLKVYNTTNSHVYSLLMDKCDFRNSTVDIEITDCYISNTNIWGVNRKYALHLGKSSQQVNNCQFVGGDEKGAVWIEDTDDGYNIEIIKITNCYFDGSYGDVKSGIGLNAKQMRYSNISNSSFWYQKKDGMLLDGCFGNTFVGLTFEGNGRDNLTKSVLNNAGGYADIKITNLTYDNIFSDIIFTANGSYHIKNKAIHGIDTNTYEEHYNYLTNLTILDFNNYDSNAFDFSFPYVGINIKGTDFKQNNINGSVKIDGELQATTGFKTSVLFSHNAVVGNINTHLSPNGQTKANYLVCNNGCLLDIGVNVETGITNGTLTIQVLRNAEVIAEQVMDKTSPYFKITNFAYGDNRIYKGDLLKVKLITSSDLNNCDYLTTTINITQ